MYNKNSNTFENYYLDMQSSIEKNIFSWRQHHLVDLAEYQVNPAQNAWLNCSESVDKVLEQVISQGKLVAQQAGELDSNGLLSQQMQALVDRLQALGDKLINQTVNKQHQEIYQEYQQLADHIMPTLARINQRVEARREAVGGQPSPNIPVPAADETLDVALRAALKRRI